MAVYLLTGFINKSLCKRRLEHLFMPPCDKPWQKLHNSRRHKWMKRQMNKFLRRNKFNENIVFNRKRKPTKDWEF